MACVLFFACSVKVCAQETTASAEQELLDQLPQELEELMEQQADSVELVTDGSFGELVQSALDALTQKMTLPVKMLARSIAVLALAATARALSPPQQELSVTAQLDTVVTLALFFLICTPLLELLELLEESVWQCRNFLTAFVPCYAALLVSSGQPATGAVFGGFFLSGAASCADLLCRFLLPLCRVFLAFSLSAALSTELDLSGASALVLRVTKKVLVICATLFSAVLCVQTIVAGAGDGLAQKAGKLLVSSAVPVVGRAVSDAMSTVYASLAVIKSTSGVAGICAAVALLGPVLLQCAAYYLALCVCTAAARLFGHRQCEGAFRGFCNCVELYAAILSFFAVLIVVCLALMMRAGG